MGLMLHCGADLVTRQQVLEVKTPPRTDTWVPIAHDTLIARVELALGHLNLKVGEAAHALAKDGARYFGLLKVVSQTEPENQDYAYVLGLRNSHDKGFTASLAVGSNVFVCDNLAFSGEITIARKHTVFIERDLPILTSRAVGLLQQKWHTMDQRIQAYQQAQLTDSTAHDFVIRSLDVGAITVQQIPKVLAQWRNPAHEEFKPRTAWSLFNAITEVQKENSLALLPRRTINLHSLMDNQVGFTKLGTGVSDVDLPAWCLKQNQP